MKLSVSIPCFFRDIPLCDAVRRVAALGYTAVEAWAIPSDTDARELRAVCEREGVSFLALCPPESRMTSPEHRTLYLDGLKRGCENILSLGGSKLITQVGDDTGAPRPFQHASILAALEGAKPILEEYGVTLMIAPLNTYFDHKGYYLDSSIEGFALVKEAGHPLIKVVYDIYHMQIMEGNIIPTVTANLDKIAHLHAAGHPGRREPWRGENDYRFIFDAIDAAGYTGYCGLEYRPALSVEESLKEAIKYYGK